MREAPRRRLSTATRGASAPPGGGILPSHPRPAPEHRTAPLGAIHGTNGNTGVSDVIIGNHHCRLLWDALQSKEEMIIRKPPDGGEPMRIPIDWRMTRLPQAALTQAQLVAKQDGLS